MSDLFIQPCFHCTGISIEEGTNDYHDNYNNYSVGDKDGDIEYDEDEDEDDHDDAILLKVN